MVFLRCPETKFPHCFRIFRVFQKCHLGGRRGLFFAVRTKFRFLRVFLVWALPGAVQEVVGRETFQNKGFRSNFALWGLVDLRWTRCIAFMLQSIFDADFSASHKFGFSEVPIFDQIGFGRQKKAWGCRTEEIFKMTFFPFCPGGAQFAKFLARFRFYSSVAVWVRFGPLPEICLRLRCGWFFRSFPVFFFRQRFCEFEKGSFENPLSSFRVLLFSAFSSSAWVDATLHVCFGAVGPKPFFSFCFLFVRLQKHCFPPERVIFVHFSMSHCLSPWFPSLLLFIPCLSLFLLFIFLVLPCFLFLFVTFLVFLLFFLALFLCFCFMTTTTTSKY